MGAMFMKLQSSCQELDGWQVEQAMEDAIKNIPGVRAEINSMEMGPPVGKDIQIRLRGEDLKVLTDHTKMIRAHLEEMEGLVAVDDTAPMPGIEWQIEVDRAKAAMTGADVSSVGAAIQLITNGVLVGRYRLTM